MTRTFCITAAMATLCACSQSAEPQRESTVETAAVADNVLSPAGFGPFRVGEAPALRIAGNAQARCRVYQDPSQPNLAVMAEDGIVTRVSAFRASPAKTAKGVGVGSTEAQVRAAYPDAVEPTPSSASPPAASGGGTNLIAWSDASRTEGIRFEIDGEGRVLQIHAGRAPALTYAQGCPA